MSWTRLDDGAARTVAGRPAAGGQSIARRPTPPDGAPPPARCPGWSCAACGTRFAEPAAPTRAPANQRSARARYADGVARPLVICPLEIEAREIRREVGDRAIVVVGGLGPRCGETARRLLAGSDRPSRVILAGVCGGLTTSHAMEGHAVRVDRVVTLAGADWQCPIAWDGVDERAEPREAPSKTEGHAARNRAARAAPSSSPVRALYAREGADPSVTLVAVDDLIASPRAKKALAERAGAAYVDMESHHVARACEDAGVSWGVARAVSDDADTALPAWLIRSITPDGGTRTAYSARQALLHPWQIPALIRIMRATREAAGAAGRAAARMLDAPIRPRASRADLSANAVADADAVREPDRPDHSRTDGPVPVGPAPVPQGARSVLVVGGTFDPPHVAHVALPRTAARAIGADATLYVPAARSPHKSAGPTASDDDRIAMLGLALAAEPGAAISTLETERAGRAGADHGAPAPPSYTIDTIRELRALLGPAPRLRLFLGADQAALFHTWKDARDLIALAEPVVALREPHTTPDSLLRAMAPHWSAAELDGWRGRIVPAALLPASATALRAAPSPDHPTISRDLHPDVREYIVTRRLYGASVTGAPQTLER